MKTNINILDEVYSNILKSIKSEEDLKKKESILKMIDEIQNALENIE